MMPGMLRTLRARLHDARGSMTILTTGVLVVILMVIAVGTAITAKRSAARKKGGNCSSEAWIATKLSPHTTVTSTARRARRSGTGRAWGPVSPAVQRKVLHCPFRLPSWTSPISSCCASCRCAAA